MADDDQVIQLAAAQFGLLTSRQLRDLGFGPHAFDDRVAGRHWERVTDEVLRRAGSSRDRGQLALAAVLDAGPGAVLSHSSAASWWGLKGCRLLPLHVTSTSRSSRRPDVEVLHTVRELHDDWTTTLDRIPIVRPQLLALQLFAQFRAERAERFVDAMWSMRLLSGPALSTFLDEVGARGRDGTAGLRRYVEQRGESYVPPASGLEGRARSILRDAGFEMRPEVDLGQAHWVGRVDLLHVELPLVVEVQSERFHAALCDRRADSVRAERLAESGFELVEIWDTQVWHRPWEVVRAVHLGARAARRRSVRQK